LVSQLGGPIILTQYVDTMKVTNKSDKQEMRRNQENAFEKFLAYTYLENSDKTKYGSLMNNLKQQQSLKHDQYPKTIADALNILNSHKFDNLGRKLVRRIKIAQKEAKYMKTTWTYQNYHLLRWKGDVTVVAKQVINLQNAMTITKQEKNGTLTKLKRLKFEGIKHM
jgi:hypothetical protein